jgi:hypothetical protein
MMKRPVGNYIPMIDDHYPGARMRLVQALATMTCRDHLAVEREVNSALNVDWSEYDGVHLLDAILDYAEGVDDPNLNHYFRRFRV